MSAVIKCGTTNWLDHDGLYPPDLSPEEKLAFYSTQFSIVEVGGTYHAYPDPAEVERWSELTPSGFGFHMRAHKLMTRVSSPQGDLRDAFVQWTDGLAPLVRSNKLASVLFQFPGWYRYGTEEIAYLSWVKDQMVDIPVSVEFRHRSWFFQGNAQMTLNHLERLEFVHVMVDEPQTGGATVPAVVKVTPKLGVVRFHGRNVHAWYQKEIDPAAERYPYLYTRRELEEWAERIRGTLHQTEQVHVLMNNGAKDYAVRNARTMAEMFDAGRG